MKNYAFIFARGGSKGLKDKNIKLLGGKPMIQYSIDSAIESPSIDRVFVSTDSDKIGNIALRAGATVIKRPQELATDSSPEWLSWKHAINWVKSTVGEFDGFVSLPATSPLRDITDIEAAINKRLDVQADVCISVTPASRSPYFNMVKRSEGAFVELAVRPEFDVSRRQDAPSVFDVTTVVYATTPDFVLNHNGLFTGTVTSIEVPKERAVDIDDIYDFWFAESLLKRYQG